MKKTAIACCVGNAAANFLYLTLPQNNKFFDQYIIITDKNDIKTQQICAANNTEFHITDIFYVHGCKFNRGAAYNEVLGKFNHNDQVILLDVDVFIPNESGHIIQHFNYDIESFYGCRRVIVPQYKDFEKLLKGDTVHENHLWCPWGIGYGFFQCFNENSQVFNSNPKYPESLDVAESDWKFRNQWGETINEDKEYTGLLKELPAKIWHLSEPNLANASRFWG